MRFQKKTYKQKDIKTDIYFNMFAWRFSFKYFVGKTKVLDM